MRTLLVSDLHLGGLSGIDLLRRPALREALLAELPSVDRLVLLGDTLELRHGPPGKALAAARPFFEDLGRALAGRELILCAGNHDHALLATWLQGRALEDRPPLGLEQRIEPAQASPMLARIAEWAAPARVQMAYPGLWLRKDVYATHGHYLDAHLTIPTLERLGIGLMGRLLERPAGALWSVQDYEAVTSPIYGWRDAMTRYFPSGPALNGVATVRAWRALGGGRGVDEQGASANGATGPSPWRLLATWLRIQGLKRAFPLVVSALNRAGLGPLSADLSRSELRRAGLRAMGEVAARLELREAHLIFGHTHRAGPLPGDVEAEWRGRAGARLCNCGCWTYDAVFLAGAPGESPYWPGTAVLVTDTGPPELRRLLLDRSFADLTPVPA
ncbi:MAG TPA: hypothetical protein VL972_01700 [Solirubrobacteraceae bacterium]|nr:hypothetical protein [Solirubrobacteraceae bacterium]